MARSPLMAGSWIVSTTDFESFISIVMLGLKAVDLIREAARSQGQLQPFNEDKVRQVLEEMRSLFQQNKKEVEERHSISPAIHLRHSGLERNKRCLLAYINDRAEKIRELRWQFGAVLPPEVKSNLCEPEQQFFQKYNRELANYMRSIGDGVGLDLMADLQPPKTLFIEVRCVQDYGELETEEGEIILLKKNTQHFLPRSLCEPLIRQGILTHIT
ncbi:DNA replication complex GINS protein PSF1-like [Tigriopus californicus]|uniref:DNA replication complex GINS protein PSF1-like n=1 Tax=Tigriopus californicus TaxID=6832 RepID=UPI0027DAAB84|nr:DNA replication complex GINS protein PSF1-like [Tigriopus californicus]